MSIDEELVRLRKRRDRLNRKLTQVDAELGALFESTKSRNDISVSEAARIAGVSRPLAYKLMAKVGKSGRPD